ncbi:MAG: hypothetical protein OEV78_10155 [Spirochaetia bacterium]|nr:hypothetical protein [Spirochaetia bacterium]
MIFFYQLLLNSFFFIIYSIIGFKVIESTSYAKLIFIEDSVPLGKFFFIILFFTAVAFFSISTSYAVLAKSRTPKLKKGIALDDQDIEVTPDFTIDGKEEDKENLMDLIDDKSGKILKESTKSKKKKK